VTYFPLTVSVTERLSGNGYGRCITLLYLCAGLFVENILLSVCPLLYYFYYVTVEVFRLNQVSVFACISVTVSVNGTDVFPLTDISVAVIVNGKNTGLYLFSRFSKYYEIVFK